MRHAFVRLALAAVVASAATAAARADSYVVGSLDGQNGWNGGIGGFINNNPGDEAVTTADAHTGLQSWRYTTGYGSPGQGTPYSPQLAASAGLTSSGATADTMSITVWFKPVGVLGDGSNQEIYEGTTPRNDRTGSNIYLDNTGTQIVLYTYEYGGGSFPATTIATLNDTNWHEITMTTTSSGNNPNNETTTFSVDNGPPITTTPWADQYRMNLPLPSYPSASSVKFVNQVDDKSGPASAKGFYYDDLSYSVYNSTDPSTMLASYSTSFEPAVTPVPLPAAAGVGFSMLGGFGGLAALRKRFRGKSRIA